MTAGRVQFAKLLLRREWVQEAVVETKKGMTVDDARIMVESLRRNTSKPDANTFDLMVVVAANLIREGSPIPDWLSGFAADVLIGKVKRPRQRAEDPFKVSRDFGFWRTSLEVAKRYKLPLYTNNELSEKTTAAEIVSQAAGCKVDVVVQAIKKSRRKFGGKMPGEILPQDSSG